MKRVCFIIFLLFLNSPVAAEKVDWYVTDFYPCHVLSGPKKEQGYCDQVIKGLLKRMDDYEHNVEFISSPKLAEKVSKGDPLCTLSLLKTEERQRYLLYSEPVLPVLPNGLITLRGDKRFESYLDEQGRIILSKLVTNEALVFGRIKARSYGPKIDKILDADYAKYPQILTAWGLPFVDLLTTGRIDYVISYPAAALGEDVTVYENHQAQFYSIYEDSALYFPGISCTKGELGERVINQVNQHMRSLGIDYFSPAYESWLPDSVKKVYLELLKENIK